MRKLPCLLALLLGLSSSLSRAEYFISLGNPPKYPASFKHFSYVNPAAPKGGDLLLPNPDRRTSFDSFNLFIIKGTPAVGLGLVFESLAVAAQDETGVMYGLLANDMEIAPDGLSATFTLNPAARFNNGDPVTAQDVKYSFDTLKSRYAAPQYQAQLAQVTKVEALSGGQIRYRFAVRQPELPLLVASLPVFSRKWGNGKRIDAISMELPIGSGPYRIGDYHIGRQITYQRRADYWGWPLPVMRGQYNFDRITYRYYRDETARLEAFKAGEFDFLTEYVARNWAHAYNGPKFRSGELCRREVQHHNPANMQGYVMNLRRPLFADIRVRQALDLALDFEWMNRQFFYGQYRRLNSYYANSELAAQGAPDTQELALLTPLKAQLPASVFGAPIAQPSTKPPSSLRDNLKKARVLLAEAGWTYRDGALRNTAGQPFEFEMLDDGGATNRLFAPYARNLAKLGISVRMRNLDFAVYRRRLDDFDFDMTSLVYPASPSPGQELLDEFGSKAADIKGSGNIMGLKNPAIDALISNILAAPSRSELVSAVRALDRSLMAGYYLIPQWYSATHRIAWRNRFGMPAELPLYYQANDWMLSTWWNNPGGIRFSECEFNKNQ